MESSFQAGSRSANAKFGAPGILGTGAWGSRRGVASAHSPRHRPTLTTVELILLAIPQGEIVLSDAPVQISEGFC